MRKSSFTSDLGGGIDKADLMYFARPVDADESSRLLRHRLPLAVCQATATLAIPCTGALGATPHRACIAANPPGHVSPQHSKHKGQWVAPRKSARSGQSIMPTASWTL
jgi:hypothetical protein